MEFGNNNLLALSPQVNFGPSVEVTHLVARNVFFNSQGGLCGAGACPATDSTVFGGSAGRLVVRDNLFLSSKIGAQIRRACGNNTGLGADNFFDWQRNIAMGNNIGFVR